MMSKPEITHHQHFEKIKVELDRYSPSFCGAKWLQNTLNLHTGTHSNCCLTPYIKIPVDEVKKNCAVFNNTTIDFSERAMMKKGERPPSCNYCWKQEKALDGITSERIQKSASDWSLPYLKELNQRPATKEINPTYMEVSFSHSCNFRCMYCFSHISSAIHTEIKKYGIYPDSERTGELFKSINGLYQEKNNPYIKAFWKWLPSLYGQLKVLRITGGEPLLTPSLYQLFSYIAKHPNPKLDLSINTNAGVTFGIIQKFAKQLKAIPHCNYEKITVITSLDTYGNSAEYIRYGLKFKLFNKNLRYILDNFKQIHIRITCTFSILSISEFEKFVDYIIQLKKDYKDNDILVSFYPLRNPTFQSLQAIDEKLNDLLEEKYTYFTQNLASNERPHGFTDYEHQSLKHVLEFRHHSHTPTTIQKMRQDFHLFYTEYDKRKKTSFTRQLKEISDFYLRCKEDGI